MDRGELAKCNSVDSITTSLQQQAGDIGEIRGHDCKMMESLQPTVNMLYVLPPPSPSAKIEDISLVSWKVLRRSLLPDVYYTAMPTRESDICYFCHLLGVWPGYHGMSVPICVSP
jgi:hypothetical protein